MGHGGTRAIPIPTSSGIVGPGAVGDYSHLLGYAGEESGGSSSVKVVLREGSSTGNVIGVLSLAAGAADAKWYGPQGVRAIGEIYAVVSGSGTIAGSIFLG